MGDTVRPGLHGDHGGRRSGDGGGNSSTGDGAAVCANGDASGGAEGAEDGDGTADVELEVAFAPDGCGMVLLVRIT
ncbi:hypothetical protein [Streptomyces spiralis]|uniref:hypothetical protein n=1 Tax=Streptomyces spiralis TaxID=66376 RepID=UPI0036CB58EA